jgi:tubulin delta
LWKIFILLVSNEKGWNYYNENIINKQSGSGNNWANGFFNHGPSVENKIIETISSMSEKFDYLDSIIVINSLAGGTGSGLGSYVNIILKDYIPTVNLFNVSIFPHNAGEVIVNSYNTLFSLSESYKVSDLVTIINNQETFDICKEIYKLKKIGFDNLNQIISKNLLTTLIPVY